MGPSVHISRHQMLDDLTEDEKSWLLSCFSKHSVQAGEHIFREHEMGDALFVVESGQVLVKRWITEGGVEKTLLTAGPGDVFGEMAFVDCGPRTASALMDKPGVLRKLPRTAFNSFRDMHPAAGAKVLDSLLFIVARRLRATTDAYLDAVQYNVQMSGCQTLGFHHLIADSMAVEVLLTNGSLLTGTIITAENSEAGPRLIIRRNDGRLFLIPNHAIVSISFDSDFR